MNNMTNSNSGIDDVEASQQQLHAKNIAMIKVPQSSSSNEANNNDAVFQLQNHKKNLIVEESVVPDLMKVCESMMQSSTPQHNLNVVANQKETSQSLQSLHQHENRKLNQNTLQQGHESNRSESCNGFQLNRICTGSSQESSHDQIINRMPSNSNAQSLTFINEQERLTARKSQQESINVHQNNSNSGRNSSKKRCNNSIEDIKQNTDGNQKSRKKMVGDGRWTKRFTWPDTLHREFVSAIFDVGLKHASPSSILEFMTPNEEITSERVKSHLQKYRLHRPKSKREFMESYNSALSKMIASNHENNFKNHVNGMTKMRNQELSSGEVAAQLSFSTMSLERNSTPQHYFGSEGSTTASTLPQSQTQTQEGRVIWLPLLTDLEKRSPLGMSVSHLIKLFTLLNEQLMQQRLQSENLSSAEVGFVSSQPKDKREEQGKSVTTWTSSHGIYDNSDLHDSTKQMPKPRVNVSMDQNIDFTASLNSNLHNEKYHSQRYEESLLMSQQKADLGIPQSQFACALQNQQQKRQDEIQQHNQPHEQDYHPSQQHNDTEHEMPEHGRLQMEMNHLPTANDVTRSTLEEDSIGKAVRPSSCLQESQRMKLEMQNQMAMQNKMRAIKQQEIRKYKNPHEGEMSNVNYCVEKNTVSLSNETARATYANFQEEDIPRYTNDQHSNHHASDEFWNVDMVEDQLFEFLS